MILCLVFVNATNDLKHKHCILLHRDGFEMHMSNSYESCDPYYISFSIVGPIVYEKFRFITNNITIIISLFQTPWRVTSTFLAPCAFIATVLVLFNVS